MGGRHQLVFTLACPEILCLIGRSFAQKSVRKVLASCAPDFFRASFFRRALGKDQYNGFYVATTFSGNPLVAASLQIRRLVPAGTVQTFFNPAGEINPWWDQCFSRLFI